MGYQALDVDLVAVQEVSLLPTAGDQALWAQQQAIIPFVPMLLKTGRCQAVSPNPPTKREMALKKTRAGLRPQVMGRWCQMVKKGRSALIPKTPSLALVRSLVNMRTQTQSQNLERKCSPSGESGVQKALRRTAP